MNIFAAIGHVLASAFVVVFSTVIPTHHVAQSSHSQVPLAKPVFTKISSSSASVTPQPISPTPPPKKQLTIPTKTQIILPPITAKSTISISGKTVYLTMTYSSSGGDITGTIGGDCSGTINGQYDGPITGSLYGTAKGSCAIGFAAIPVTVQYSGAMNENDTHVALHYTVTSMNINESGTTNLILSQ